MLSSERFVRLKYLMELQEFLRETSGESIFSLVLCLYNSTINHFLMLNDKLPVINTAAGDILKVCLKVKCVFANQADYIYFPT